MEDEGGEDAKLLAVPENKILPLYDHLKAVSDIHPMSLNAIQHFFEHYKDLEKGKWVKVQGWGDVSEAHQEIMTGIQRYQEENKA
jgi:inorganic pyrophosphatase